jgi:hypothetical protein
MIELVKEPEEMVYVVGGVVGVQRGEEMVGVLTTTRKAFGPDAISSASNGGGMT